MAKTSSEKLTSNHVTDLDGRIKAVLTDTSGTASQPAAAALGDTDANPTTTRLGAELQVMGVGGTTWERARGSKGDGVAVGNSGILAVALALSNLGGNHQVLVNAGTDATSSGFAVAAGQMVYNGSTLDRQRTPTVFKSFTTTAITAGTGATIWTPTSGKKFRLMGFSISSSVAGVLIFGDNAVGTVIARSPFLAAGGIATLGAADMGNGILSAAANNVLKLDGPTGNVAGMVWGTEE